MPNIDNRIMLNIDNRIMSNIYNYFALLNNNNLNNDNNNLNNDNNINLTQVNKPCPLCRREITDHTNYNCDETTLCAICLQDYEHGSEMTAFLPCDHREFCSSCANDFLSMH